MLASERYEYIMQTVDTYGAARTIQLAEQLNVSDETVRNDLINMERNGLIVRVHGGAISTKQPVHEFTEQGNSKAVDLAKEAVTCVVPHSTLLLDGGPIGHLIASFLPHDEMTVVSNSPAVIERLKTNPNITIYCTGGLLDRKTDLFLSAKAADSVSHMSIDTAILVPDSFSPMRGPGFTSQNKAEFYEKILPTIRQLCVVCPAERLNDSATFYTIPPTSVNILITDVTASVQELALIRDKGIAIRQQFNRCL